VNTLAEIESAIQTLSMQEQRDLLHHLGTRLAVAPAMSRSGPHGFRRSARGFPIVEGRAPITPEDVAEMADEA
jgi:hypothetical protein